MTDVQPDVTPEEGRLDTHYLDPKAARDVFVLPCGWIDQEGHLHQKVQIREMTGVEEELLAGKGPIQDRLNRVLANCIVDLGGQNGSLRIVHDLTAIDRLFLLIAIRRVSLGDDYSFKVTCPECGNEDSRKINLGEIPITRGDDPMARSFSGTLPSGKAYSWHVMTGRDEEWINDAAKRLKDAPLTLAILARLDFLGGEKMVRDTNQMRKAVAAIVSLGLKDRNALRTDFTKHEGDMDMELEFECSSCRHEFKIDMEVDAKSFFFPSET